MINKLYIVHGWTYDVSKWDAFIGLLRDDGFEVKMLNVPGLTKPSEKIFTIEDYVSWLDDELPKGEDVALLAHSNGGRISMNLLRRFPNRVAHLVLLDSAGVYHDDFLSKTKRRVFRTLAKIGKQLGGGKLMRKILYKMAYVHDYNDAPENMKKTMTNMLESDKTLSYESITTPTTIIWGSDDKTTILPDAHKLNREIKNSTLHVIKGARHTPPITHPDETLKIIKEALNK